MSISYKEDSSRLGNARHAQRGFVSSLEQHFSPQTLKYLDEKIINHLLDSLVIENFFPNFKQNFNDFSFVTAPAYKALEGYLFQLAKDLQLPSSGKKDLVGNYYFDEEKIDQRIDSLLGEIEKTNNENQSITEYEKKDIKSRIKEMSDFLRLYRHSPAHFQSEPIDTIEKAQRNIVTIFGLIDNMTLLLQKVKLIQEKTYS